MKQHKEGGVRFVGPHPFNIPFVRYPASVIPDEGTIGFTDGPSWRSVGVYRDGKWTNGKGTALKPDMLYWTVLA